MRKIAYLQKARSLVLSIPTLNATQKRRLVRKCDSSGEIGITERGHVRDGNSRNYSTAPVVLQEIKTRPPTSARR